MNTFQMIVTNEKDETITITTGSYGELMDMTDKLRQHGWKPKPWSSRGTSQTGGNPRKPVANVPPNIPICSHHPDAGMGHDNKNPGQYYCKGKVGDKWCGYKASASEIVRPSILDEAQTEAEAFASKPKFDF
jgi:hypothetical protein